MISIDDILQQLIIDKLNEIRSAPSLLDEIFLGKPIDDINNIKQFITTHEVNGGPSGGIRIVKHHPRDAADFPCYSIVLESQAEAEQTIGSSAGGDEVELSRMEDGWIGSDSEIFINNIPDEWTALTAYTVGHMVLPTTLNDRIYVCVKAGTSGATQPVWTTTLGANNADGTVTWVCRMTVNYESPQQVKQTYSSLETKDGRLSCHLWGKQYESENKGIWIDYQHSVLQGGFVSLVDLTNVWFWAKSNRIGSSWLQFGFGKTAHNQHTFLANISTRNVWDRIRLNLGVISNTEKDALRYMSFLIKDDSQETDIYISSLMGEKDTGTIYEENYFDNRYRIEIWTNNADLTLNLYTILLWIILRYRNYLETTWGLMEQRVDGGDIIPQPEWIPEVIYIRSLTLSCKTIEWIPRESDLTAITVKVGKVDYSG